MWSLYIIVMCYLCGFGASSFEHKVRVVRYEWPAVICFTPSDADKFVHILDQAPQPPSPNAVFSVVRSRSIRCTTVDIPLTPNAIVATLALEQGDYDIVSVIVNSRVYYTFKRKQSQRS